MGIQFWRRRTSYRTPAACSTIILRQLTPTSRSSDDSLPVVSSSDFLFVRSSSQGNPDFLTIFIFLTHTSFGGGNLCTRHLCTSCNLMCVFASVAVVRESLIVHAPACRCSSHPHLSTFLQGSVLGSAILHAHVHTHQTPVKMITSQFLVVSRVTFNQASSIDGPCCHSLHSHPNKKPSKQQQDCQAMRFHILYSS